LIGSANFNKFGVFDSKLFVLEKIACLIKLVEFEKSYVRKCDKIKVYFNIFDTFSHITFFKVHHFLLNKHLFSSTNNLQSKTTKLIKICGANHTL
jgi:hypothetical protein